MELFDTHCHLDGEAFKDDLKLVLERAKKAGVSRIVTIGASDGIESAGRAIRLAESHDWIWATAGIHPHDAKCETPIDSLRKLAEHPRVVAIGETGLDFHYDFAPKDEQAKWFRAQIRLAKEVKKPLVIHCRKAGPECLQILKEEDAQSVGGVFHCFAEDAAFAKELEAINFIVSFPGILTFKKSQTVRDTSRAIALSRIMLETDAPFLAPEPHRGKRCEPAFVLETAKMLALVHSITLEEVARITTENALKFYKLAGK